MSKINIKLAKNLKKLRNDKGLTFQELAKKTAISTQTLHRIENKNSGSIFAVLRLCKYFKTPMSELLGVKNI